MKAVRRRVGVVSAVATVAAVVVVAGLLTGAPAAAGTDGARPGETRSRPLLWRWAHERVTPTGGEGSATLVLRDLWLARPTLRGAAAARADALLARPTDGTADRYGNGYTVAAQKTCGPHVCVHFVTSTSDAVPGPGWVATVLATLESTWTAEVDGLGLRSPVPDAGAGGDDRLDVYLADLGPALYGYCAAEKRHEARTASGFCVLDNDYSPAQFPAGTAESNLRVTAAHEFFHAVQYAYDAGEDAWLMESTATWMEEQVADDVDDNRQFLPYGQLYEPSVPLDSAVGGTISPYGNWILWQYLGERFGTSMMEQLWRSAGSLPRDGGRYSVQALRQLMRGHGGLGGVYADFAAGNVVPAATYAEGEAFGAPEPSQALALRPSRRPTTTRLRLDHLSADSLRLVQGQRRGAGRWRLRLRVRTPGRHTSAVRLVSHRADGSTRVAAVRVRRNGVARTSTRFDPHSVAALTLTLVNTSGRYRCDRRTALACAGRPLDDGGQFTVRARVVRR